MKFRKCLIILVLSFTSFCWTQSGEDKEFYTQQIDEITEQLKKDPLNYKFIWKKLELQTRVLFWEHHTDLYNNYPAIGNTEDIEYMPNEGDYYIIFKNVIKKGKFSIADEGDFYISRISFYEKTGQIDKAIEDAYYLKGISHSYYGGRLKYYQDKGLTYLFRLFAIKEDYQKALAVIDFIIAQEKFNAPISYFSRGNSSVFKIKLFKRFKREDAIVPYLKQLIRENFDYYFDTTDKKYEIKRMGFQYLKQLVNYMERFDSEELPKYQKIYDQLSLKLSSGHEAINHSIDDARLKEIIN
ncbi:hypothetical protein [Maribacter sp.]|uniref:hypothetical protein n=1 Tax=Maribacter sp. TaxID=1897614 RepID=UPI0025C11B37|nr:hypothetical protein [Maribacter sp.]